MYDNLDVQFTTMWRKTHIWETETSEVTVLFFVLKAALKAVDND